MEQTSEIPNTPGVYWYYNDKIKDSVICDIIEVNGRMRAKFTNGSYQHYCGKKDIFIGPIIKPVIYNKL